MTTTDTAPTGEVGALLRRWRRHRNVSQLALSAASGVSARHLSCLETGKASPSREMVLRLCEHLDVPLRERNTLLAAAGFAPRYQRRGLGEPSMRAVNDAVTSVLGAHEPHPALAVDRGWDLVAANEAAYALLEGVADELLVPPVNVLRVSLHPAGLAPRIANLGQWTAHVLGRLDREVAATGDARLTALRCELDPGHRVARVDVGPSEVVVPLRLRAGDRVLSFLSLTTVFGSPNEVTVSELAIESFFPADAETAAYLAGVAG